jgi:hypothetical protein
MKKSHEKWVRQSLQSYDPQRQRDDETYASIIEDWINQSRLDNWEGWTYGLLNAGQPRMSRTLFKELQLLNTWILSRIWPKRYTELEAAFENFRRVLNDLLATFEEYIDRSYGDQEMYVTEKFYRRGYGNRKLELRLTKEYANHVNLVQDLTLELARAANYVCDMVRQSVLPSFRLQEGVVIVRVESSLHYHQYRVEYRGQERVLIPFPGLDSFREIRTTRDMFIGDTTEYNYQDDEE